MAEMELREMMQHDPLFTFETNGGNMVPPIFAAMSGAQTKAQPHEEVQESGLGDVPVEHETNVPTNSWKTASPNISWRAMNVQTTAEEFGNGDARHVHADEGSPASPERMASGQPHEEVQESGLGHAPVEYETNVQTDSWKTPSPNVSWHAMNVQTTAEAPSLQVMEGGPGSDWPGYAAPAEWDGVWPPYPEQLPPACGITNQMSQPCLMAYTVPCTYWVLGTDDIYRPCDISGAGHAGSGDSGKPLAEELKARDAELEFQVSKLQEERALIKKKLRARKRRAGQKWKADLASASASK